MATKSNNTNQRKSPNTNRSSANRPAAKARTTNSKKPEVQKKTEPDGFVDYFNAFKKTPFFKPLLLLIVIVIGVLFDVLIAWNNYDRFYLILGIELLIVAIYGISKLLLDQYNQLKA